MSMIGRTLGHYSVSALLGKGGMGEVYKAKDQKLGRDVAIKVLPEEFAKDVDRVARFQREAKLLASLNHPNIASIHGLEESNGTHFLVMEFVEGVTLEDYIAGNAGVPAGKKAAGTAVLPGLLKLALQIAEALEAAHEKGVIHRDLKPANIKVTPDGKVKVLDFGLAKAFAGDSEDINLSNSPTLSAAATQQGVILGTAAYMSPEQARGNPVDKRADIWAFGVVLFEMLTGKSLFSGVDVSSTLAKVLEREPDYSALPPNLHPRIRLLLERCLEKDSKDRYGVIGDARVDIQKVLADPSGVFAQPVSAGEYKPKLQQMLPRIAAALVLGGIIVGVAVWKLKPTPPPEPRPVMRFDYDFPEDQEFLTPGFMSVAVSTDGAKIVYAANNQLYLKHLNEFTATPIQGTDENPASPFFSPDGQWVGYYSLADGQLKKIAIMGGAPVTLCEATVITQGMRWGTDDMIIFSQADGIMRVSANGGTPEIIVKGEEGEYFSSPQILPDRKTVLFTVIGEGEPEVAVQSLESGERKNLFAGNPVQYLPTGHLVYGLGNDLFAIAFDLDALEVVGGPVPLVEGVYRMASFSAPQSAISDSGTLVYIPGTGMTMPAGEFTLVWVDRKGKLEEIAAPPRDFEGPRISPDGTKVALTISAGTFTDTTSDIWIWNLNRETLTRLTFNENSSNPLWTPDGQRIVFVSGDVGRRGIYWRKADGTGNDELLVSVPDRSIAPRSWSSDGRTLVTGTPSQVVMMMRASRGGGLPWARPKTAARSGRGPTSEGPPIDIGLVSMEGDHEWNPLLQESYFERQPQISPDGKWMAYMSTESGHNEIYVRPFPEVDTGKWQVSTDGGSSPLWSPDGRELFYLAGASLMTVDVETEPVFKAGKPETLFQLYDIGLSRVESFDINPDGKRFLMLKRVESTEDESVTEAPRKINIVLNWFEELKERVPAE